MDLTPQSMRSPVSPFDDESKHSFDALRTTYPSAPQPEHSSMAESSRGLGIFCPMPSSENVAQDLPPSPQLSEHWTQQPPMVSHDYYPQSSTAPNISTAAFDPFSGFESHPSAHNMPSEEAPDLIYCQSPPSSNMTHRSSISSSCSPPPQQGGFYTPRVKSEDIHEWYPSPGNDQVFHRSLAGQNFSPYSTTVTNVHGTTEDLFKGPASEWAKSSPAQYSMPYHSMSGREHHPAPVLPSANRIKKKRQMTTPKEATHNCGICGKLFKRSYNWKSHMETHNPDRKYPHPCTASIDDQPCTKKFQRKTDLDRHVESVHLKARNHRCDLCGHRFARRDTLRRHTEDGCPKRFDLATSPAPRWTGPSRSFSTPNPISSMPPPSSAMSLHPASAHPASQPYFPRPDFVHSPLQNTQSIFA